MTSHNLKEHRGIALILVVFLILGCIYSTVTPVFEAPDEIQHYFHVKHIADGEGLPLLTLQRDETYGQEGGQPSLFYLLGALVTFWINTDDAEELLDYNPYRYSGMPTTYGNKNMILHSERESFPYRGTTLAIHLLRILSLLFGALAVLGTYLLALQVFTGQKALALGAAVLVALSPQFLFISGSVNNDALITALCSLALLLSSLLLNRGPSSGLYVGLGIVVGLAALTKLTGLGLLVVVLVTFILMGVKYSLGEAIKGGLVAFGLVVLLAGWWYVRNWVLYQDPTGLNMFFDALGGPPGRNLSFRRFVRELEGLKVSYWAVFGWLNVLVSRWLYRFFDSVMVLGVIGLPLAVFRGLKKPRAVSWVSLVPMLVWIPVVAAGYVRYNQLVDAATGRLIFPAISCFSILLSWGLVQLPPRKYTNVFVGLLTATMLVVAVICPFLYIAPAYARPATFSEQEIESIPNPRDINYGGRMRLLGHELQGDVCKPGDYVYVTLYWQASTVMERDYSVSLRVLTPNGGLIGQEDSYPGLGTFPTSVWNPGDVIADRAWVRIHARTSAPTIGWLGVDVYHRPTMERLTPSEEGQDIGQVLLEPVKVIPRQVEEYAVSHAVRFNLANTIDLLGYDLDKTAAHAGDLVGLTLYWQARQEIDRDYTTFVHLIDAENRTWAQKDSQPRNGDYPTSFWDREELVKDQYEIALPVDVPAGDYQIEVGLYLLSTGERLQILDDAGQAQDNRVLLDTVRVVN